jgi:hypothetical protein
MRINVDLRLAPAVRADAQPKCVFDIVLKPWMNAGRPEGRAYWEGSLEHDPEKWEPVSRKDHAQTTK